MRNATPNGAKDHHDLAHSNLDEDIWQATRELGWFELGLNQFRGKLGWVTWVLMVVQTSLFAISAWCSFQFFNASETLAALKWGLPAVTFFLAALQIKLSLMPQIQADRILRELKKLQHLIEVKK